MDSDYHRLKSGGYVLKQSFQMKFINQLADKLFQKLSDESDDRKFSVTIEVNQRLFEVEGSIEVAFMRICKTTSAINVTIVQEFDECGKVVFELGEKALGKLNDRLEEML